MAINSPTNSGLRCDPPVVGDGLSSIGGPMVVLNGNSEVQTYTYDDPYSCKQSSHATADDIYPLIIPDFGIYLEVFHAWAGDNVGANVTTIPQVRVFGKTPEPQMGTAALRVWPQDIDSGWPDLSNYGMWQLLNEPDSALHYLSLGIIAEHALRYNTSWIEGTSSSTAALDMYMSDKQYVYLAGCKEVLVTIETAAVISGTATGMIVGRIVG